MPDFILNGVAHGSVAQRLMDCNFDTGMMRPYVDDDNQACVVVNQRDASEWQEAYDGDVLVTNAPATLRKQEWELLDRAVIDVARSRLGLITDLRSRGLSFTIPNGMGKTVFQYQAVSDITDATVSMDPLRQSEEDRPEYDLRNLPLPVIHKDFRFSAREIQVSRSEGGPGIDTTMIRLATRKVLEMAEKLFIGSTATYTYGGGSVYGLTNFPQRITSVTLTAPTAGGWTGETLKNEVLEMIAAAEAVNYFGPYILFLSRNFSTALADDYRDNDTRTVLSRLQQFGMLSAVRTLDYLTGSQAILVQASEEVIRAIIGMDPTTIQWETQGGMQLNFKVMAIMVPQLRYDFEEAAGIVHAAA